MLSILGKGIKSINAESSEEYVNSILEYEKKIQELKEYIIKLETSHI
jgi:uncharacterized protein YlzI (FlbEa/FlbD family)